MNLACSTASLSANLFNCPFLNMCIASTPSSVFFAEWKERKHCAARHLPRIARWSYSTTLLRTGNSVACMVKSAGGNFAETARLLGVRPNNLHHLIRNFGLCPLPKK